MAAILIACIPLARASAAETSDFAIQVSPSPLVVSVTPGQTQTATLTVRNFSSHSETLQPGIRGMHVDGANERVSLNDVLPANITSWMQFSSPSITVEPGQSVPLTITFNTPQNVGFSYSVAITLTSTRTAGKNSNGAAIRPQVAVFCLINVHRDDAKNELSIVSFKSDKSRYAFLPADFQMRIKNSGNVISQPSGALFIQRAFSDTKPITTIPINKGGSYVLPGTSRNFTSSWTNGFPLYATNENGKRQLHWDWKHVGELRLGRYVAKAVIVYDNGHQDVPLTTSYTFWVIPWWFIFFVVIVTVVLVMGLMAWGKLLFIGTKKVRGYAKHRKK